MELELKKACFDAYEAAGELTLTQEETAETIVPDYCPDIARIIETTGKVFLHSREMRDGRAEISGTVRVTVLYTPEGEGGIRTLEFAMPFTVETDGRSLPDCAVRVRGAKGRSWRSPRRLVAVYLGLWVFALVVFLLMDPTDAMGYALLFHWLLLPIAAFVISLRIGELVRRDGRMWLLPLALGLLYMLADFLTFRLANMLAFDKINLPQWDLFFIGAAISALGLLIGRLLGRRRSKPA